VGVNRKECTTEKHKGGEREPKNHVQRHHWRFAEGYAQEGKRAEELRGDEKFRTHPGKHVPRRKNSNLVKEEGSRNHIGRVLQILHTKTKKWSRGGRRKLSSRSKSLVWGPSERGSQVGERE